MPTARQHRKPEVPRVDLQAEKVVRQMYSSLTAPGAPEASPTGYVMGAAMAMKMLIDQAVQQGEDRSALKALAMSYIQMM